MNAILFGVQGNTYRLLGPGRKNLFVSGVVGGMAQCIVISPMELVKTQMQLQGQGYRYKHLIHHTPDENLKYSGSVDCLKKIYKTGGFRACFRGMIPTLAREGPAVGVYISSYHELCSFFVKPHESVDDLGVLPLLFSGGMAGSASWIVTYPVDVVKSRYQADLNGAYVGVLDCTRKTYNSEGFAVFFRGLSTALVRAFPVNAATLATVTLVLRYGNKKPTEM